MKSGIIRANHGVLRDSTKHIEERLLISVLESPKNSLVSARGGTN